MLDSMKYPLQFVRVSEDLESKPLVVDGDRDHGKSSSIRTLVKYLEENTDYVVKVFDCSLVWFHCSSLSYRQLINRVNEYVNLGNCVYEIGGLPEPKRVEFVARIIKEDYEKAREGKLVNSQYVDENPRILYIFEEANTYVKSQTLNKKGWIADTLKDFISLGRNYGQDCILICTRVAGEVSPGFRNRCNWLLGRISGYDERNKVKGATSSKTVKVAENIERFHFVYYNGYTSQPFRILDIVESTPTTVKPPPEPEIETQPLRVIEERRAHSLWPMLLFILLCLWAYLRGGG